MPTTEEKKRKNREAMRRHRAQKKAEGWKPPTTTEEQKAYNRERQRRLRERWRTMGKDPDTWWKKNRDKHRANGAKWRNENPERHRQLTRDNQRARRGTPWGAINNRLWALIHAGVRANVRQQRSKYADAMGYTWADLRAHLEAQFADGMTWENWGEVWELDHIEPLSRFHYVDLLDPLFKQAWALSNLRPLLKHLNQTKGCKPEA